MIICAIESSCDDLSCALYNTKTSSVIAMKTVTQQQHDKFGGVVPDIASLQHAILINDVLSQTLLAADYSIDDIDVFSATITPGLPGALLVGSSFAKALAWSKKKPFIPINHLQGHVYSAYIEKKNIPPFPHLCLSVSGGHTALYKVINFQEYQLLGSTKDDAAGECFDKIGRIIGLGFPAGAMIEQYAQSNNFSDVYRYPRLSFCDYSFSFSGLKTAVLYDLVKRGLYDIKSKKSSDIDEQIKKNVSSSLLCAVSDVLASRVMYAFEHNPDCTTITFVGGVSCNEFIVKNITKIAAKYHKSVLVPSLKSYCVDNAAMIAYVASCTIAKYTCYPFYNYTNDIK